MLSFLMSVAAAVAAQTATQPPAEELLVDRSFELALDELTESPRVRVETIGRSHLGRPIQLLIVARPEVMADLETHRRRAISASVPEFRHPTLGSTVVEEPTKPLPDDTLLPVLFAGDSWGHEAAQVEGLLGAARRLAFGNDEETRSALSRTIALILPLMNPDGRAEAIEEWKRTPLSSGNSGVGNAYGFLLNRDFIHATQPESRAVVAATMRWRPVAGMDQHEDMFNLGVRLREVCFVEPFEAGFDVEEHPLTVSRIAVLGQAIAARWRDLGFHCLFDPDGDATFAPIPRAGEGLSPVASSAGRLNFMWGLHGIAGFITESARTPGSQSWEARVEQKISSVIATLLAVSREPSAFASAIHARKLEEARAGADDFLVVPLQGQLADALRELLDLLELHGVTVLRAASPYPAFVVPLAQAEAKIARHLLLAERSRLNALGPALGVTITPSSALSEAERRAFQAAELEPAHLHPSDLSIAEREPFVARPGVAATRLVNRLLAAGAARISTTEGGYWIDGPPDTTRWHARRIGVSLEAASRSTRTSFLGLPRVAVYQGQGVSAADAGESVWALERGGFPYQLIDARSLDEVLDDVDVLVVPHGAAGEIVHGWNPEGVAQRDPWEPAEPPRGIGTEGLEAIRAFVYRGGVYVGLGAGGALLAGPGFLEISRARSVPANVGLGIVRLRPVDSTSPLWFGYGKGSEPVFFFGPPGTPGGWPPGSPEGGFAFESDHAVALYDGVELFPEELSFTVTDPLESAAGNAALVHELHGRGHVVLMGFAPTFRGQWKRTFPFLYNALYLASPR